MIRVSLSHHTTPHHNPALLAREPGPLRVPDSHVAEAPKGAKSVQFFLSLCPYGMRTPIIDSVQKMP